MIAFQNDLNYNLYRQRLLGGNVSGLWKNNVYFLGSNSYPVPKYHYLTAQFNDFEKNIFSDGMKVNYHLSGYGTQYNEALTSFLGESSERYSFTLLYQNIKNIVVRSTYSDLKKDYPNELVLDLSLVNVYFKESDSQHFITSNDVLSWVPMHSLFNPDQKVFIPLQMVVLFDNEIFNNEKQFLNSAVSTGTASHETFEKSLQNALVEILQIDSYNLWWYAGLSGTTLNVNIQEKISSWFDGESVSDFLNNFIVHFTDITFDKSIPIVVCEISAKNKPDSLPKYVVGVQGGTDINKCVYRSFFEALTVLEYSLTAVWNDADKFNSVKNDLKNLNIDNLDDNVVFFAKYGLQNLRKEHSLKLNQPKKAHSLQDIVKSIEKFSKYACYLNITSTEFFDKNMTVSRAIVPELLPIALPSFPPYQHPRYREFGGVVNNVPHPMA